MGLATIQVKGTFRGTIANQEGQFSLKLEQVPAILLVTHIGYKSQEITVAVVSSNPLDVRLTPAPYVLQETTVTPENPAQRIMRQVIQRKQEWNPRIQSYTAEAYARRVLENDTSIVFIGEVASQISWDRQQGLQEVIKSQRFTANAGGEGFSIGSMVDFVNLYDDEIEVFGNRAIGPTHPDALHHYQFELIGQRQMDEKTVYDISVTPKSGLQTALVGKVAVLDGEFGVLEAELSPVASITESIPVPIVEKLGITYSQQFRPFAQGVWLPVDFQYEAQAKIGMIGLHFPLMKIKGTSQLTDYQVNAARADSVRQAPGATRQDTLISAKPASGVKVEVVAKTNRAQVDTQAVRTDSLFTRLKGQIPLSIREQTAYATIDSTNTRDAFKPTGFLARFVDEDEEKQPQKGGRLAEFKPAFRPELWFNRVEAAHLGLGAEKGLPGRFSLSLAGGYSTGLKRWFGGTAIRHPWGKEGRGWVEMVYRRGAQTRWRSDSYRPAYTSALPLVGLADYFDYYWREGLQVKTGYQLVKFGTQVTLGFVDEQDASLAKHTDYSLLGGDKIQRINPSVQEGRLRTLTLALVCGRGYRPLGLGANRRLAVEIDHSADWLGGDFSFTQYTLTLDWHQKTFFKRRLTPNALDLRLVAGTATGELPLQRFGALDTALGFFTPFGVFRTVRNHPDEGERHLALFWEHNFRTVPFEVLRLRGLARRGFGVVVQGASGRTWIAKERRSLLGYKPRYPDSFHHEVGVSLVLYHLVRLDITKRLGQDTWTIGASIARFDFE